MPKIQPTTTVTVDGNTFEVANMSQDVQRLISYFDEWRQDEADQTTALLKTRAALNDIQNTLAKTLQDEHGAASEQAVEAAEPAPVAKKARNKKAAS